MNTCTREQILSAPDECDPAATAAADERAARAILRSPIGRHVENMNRLAAQQRQLVASATQYHRIAAGVLSLQRRAVNGRIAAIGRAAAMRQGIKAAARRAVEALTDRAHRRLVRRDDSHRPHRRRPCRADRPTHDRLTALSLAQNAPPARAVPNPAREARAA